MLHQLQQKKIFFILSCFASVLMIVLLGSASYWYILRNSKVETEWCSSSMEIKHNGNPDLLGQLIWKTDKNTDRNKTCGEMSVLLDTAVAQKTKKSYDSDANPEYLLLNITMFGCKDSQRNVSIVHLYGIASHETPVPGKTTKVNWYFTKGHEIEMEALPADGVINIQQAGYYYVSSSLTLRAQNKTRTNNGKPLTDLMSHVVNVVGDRDGTERRLLENVKSMCEMATEQAEWSSYIGAAFHLNEHDKVYVATSHPYNIVTGNSNNFLSIHTII